MAIDLSALDDVQIGENAEQIYLLDIKKITHDPNQPRKEFDKDKLKELADDIKQNGLIQPIVVRKLDDGKYQIIAGERRYRAMKLLGQKQIRAIIGTYDDYAAMSENIKRDDLKFWEISEFIARQMEKGEKQSVIAKKLGYDKSLISKYASWNERPSCIEFAHKVNLFDGIKLASRLISLYKAYPEETENWINQKIVGTEEITERDINLFKKTLTEPEIQGTVSDTSQPADETLAEVPSEIEKVEPEPITEEKPARNQPEGKNKEIFRAPLIMCSVNQRECTLQYRKRPTTEGFVVVKYEDGLEEEVLAENVRISYITE